MTSEPVRALIGYAVTLVALLVLDLVWLRYASDAFFRPEVGDMLTDKPNFIAAGLFYVLFAAGLVYFVVLPALRGGNIFTAALDGAFLGFLAYMTFDMTNLAILKHWTVKIAIIDMSWGAFASGLASVAAYTAAARF